MKVGDVIYLNLDPKLLRANGFRGKRGKRGINEVEVVKIYSNRVIVMFGNCERLVVPMRLLKVIKTDSEY